MMYYQNILEVFTNEKLVVHDGNKYAYDFLFNEILPKKVVVYGEDVNSILIELFKLKKFYNYWENKKQVYVILKESNLEELFNFLNLVRDDQSIFLIIHVDKYPCKTGIRDLDSRLNAFLNIEITVPDDVVKLIDEYFLSKYIKVPEKILKYIAIRVNRDNIKEKVDIIATESLRQKKKISINFIKKFF